MALKRSLYTLRLLTMNHMTSTLFAHVTVLRGRNVTLGWFRDLLDTPDPYVQLWVADSPNKKKRTRTIQNNKNPVWNQTFRFVLESASTNILRVTLKEADIFKYDDTIGKTQELNLSEHPKNEPTLHSLLFGKNSYVDLELLITPNRRRSIIRRCLLGSKKQKNQELIDTSSNKQNVAVQARSGSRVSVEVNVLRGRNVTLGALRDLLDTPDPYVELTIPNTPYQSLRTKTVSNTKNPEWHEKFKFILDPEMTNILQVTLKEADTFKHDDLIGETQEFELNDLPADQTTFYSFNFNQVSHVDVEFHMQLERTDTTDLRHSLDLCAEEIKYLKKRRKVVYDALKKILKDRAPTSLQEVPTVALLGSGGGFRAMIGMSGAITALSEAHLMDCFSYVAGLSGSAWYLSTLYSDPKWPNGKSSRQFMKDLQKYVRSNKIVALLTSPSWMYSRVKLMAEKKLRDLPASATDIVGYWLEEILLKERQPEVKFTHHRQAFESGQAPMPIYTCIHVKESVSAVQFSEWLEFTPYEVGMEKYGTFMRTDLFGNKFYLGKMITEFPELPLRDLQGIWGSCHTVLLQRFLDLQNNKGTKHQSLKDLEEIIEEGESISEKNFQERKFNIQDAIPEEDELDAGETLTSIEEIGSKIDLELEEDNDPPTTDQPIETKEDSKGDEQQYQKGNKVVCKIVNRLRFLKTRAGRAGQVHNFLRGLQMHLYSKDPATMEFAEVLPSVKRMYLVDSGLAFNSPYPPLLRQAREIDLLVSFDFSARENDYKENPLKELEIAEQWAKENGVPFPPINAEETFKREGMKEYYVFRHPTDPACPIILHIVLVNLTFKDFKKPGVPRETEEDKVDGNFRIFEDPNESFGTFKFDYSKENFENLAYLMEYNALLCEDVIKDLLAECVEKLKHKENQTETHL